MGPSGGVSLWIKCLGSMNVFVKDDITREVPVLKLIKQRDPFMCLKTGTWGLTLDLSVESMPWLLRRFTGMPMVRKQKAQRRKGKEIAPLNSKGKEKAPSRRNPRERWQSAQLNGLTKKKLLASAM